MHTHKCIPNVLTVLFLDRSETEYNTEGDELTLVASFSNFDFAFKRMHSY